MASMLDYALWYAQQGWAVFPCRFKSKVPLAGTRGFYDATTDESQIREWFSGKPLNIAIATGARSGIVVLDIDPRNGGAESLKSYSGLPATFSARTGGGGMHYYYRSVEGSAQLNGKHPKAGLDIKADGGYVIAPPSIHESGKLYEVDQSLPLASFPLEAFSGLYEAGTPNSTVSTTEEIIAPGERNAKLFSFACKLRRDGASPKEIEGALLIANKERCKPPLHDSEVRKIAWSTARYEPEPEIPILVSWPVLESRSKQTITSPAPALKQHTPIAYPSGLMGGIARFIYDQAPRPAQNIAIAGAIGLLAGICGRAYSVSGTGLNQYTVLLAETGRGKEAIQSGIGKLVSAARKTESVVDTFVGPGGFASGQSILKELSAKPIPSFVSVIGEFGIWLQEILSIRAGEREKVMRRVLLDLYGKSGSTDTLGALVYSDRTKNTAIIKAPAFSLLGESTPVQFFNAVDEGSISMGLLPRLVVIDYDGLRSDLNEGHETMTPSDDLVSHLCEVIGYSITRNQKGANGFADPVPVRFDNDAKTLDKDFSRQCDAKINSGSSPFLELWNRAHLNTMKLASLVAVGESVWEPSITEEMYHWAMGVVTVGIECIMSRFESGETGEAVSSTKQMNDLRRSIEYYFSAEFPYKSYRADPEARAAGYVPAHYFQTRLSRIGSFRNATYTNRAIEDSIKIAIEQGLLEPFTHKSSTGRSGKYFRVAW